MSLSFQIVQEITDNPQPMLKSDIYGRYDEFTNEQQIMLVQILDYMTALGGKLWHEEGGGIFLSLGDTYSDIFSPHEERELSGVANTLNFLCAARSINPDSINLLAERLTHLEELANIGLCQTPPSPATPAPNPVATQIAAIERVSKLDARAHRMGGSIWRSEVDGHCTYYRKRKPPLAPGQSCVFTMSDVLDASRKHHGGRWDFFPDELDELEAFIAHDEVVFAQYQQAVNNTNPN